MANKRVIDLAELSQTVQEGQYILSDSAGGTGKMNLKRILDDNKTEIDDTLSISGYAADAKAVGDALDAVNGTLATKADVDGTYTDMAVGDVVSDKSVTDTTPYLFRPSASVGSRAYETIVGASVGWNQLVQSGATSVTVQSGHKYYAKINGTESLGASTGSAITINDSSKDMVTDLTAELGTTIADYIYSLEQATAGSGIAKLREWGFCTGYAEYDAGSIESVKVTEKKVVGFNQWDEEWEVGGYADATGNSWNTSDRIRSKTADYIAVIPNMDYYFRGTSSFDVYWYDADKAYIGHNAYTDNTVHTSPNNAWYMRFATYANYGTTYNHNICINISSDRNGEYEPYHSQSYSLGSDVLRGIFKLDANNNLYADGDVKTSDGMITRKYGIVDLGTLNWTYQSVQTRFYTTGLGGIAKGAPTNERANAICPKYEVSFVPDSTTRTGVFAIASTTGNLFIKDTAYSDATSFKTAMSGVYLVYELATPTTEQSTPFTSPQTVYPDGTEEFITENGIPVGHSTDYPYSIKALAEELIDIPDVPTANGTYVLKATRSASGITYAWVTG